MLREVLKGYCGPAGRRAGGRRGGREEGRGREGSEVGKEGREKCKTAVKGHKQKGREREKACVCVLEIMVYHNSRNSPYTKQGRREGKGRKGKDKLDM